MTSQDWSKDAYQWALLRDGEISDPGDAGTVLMASGKNFASCALVSTGTQTRTIAGPPGPGMKLCLWCKTYGGIITASLASAYDDTGTTAIRFHATGHFVLLESVESGANTYRWRIVGKYGVTGPEADKAEVVTATNVITANETGKTFFLNSTTEFVSTLPAPALGLKYKFIVSGAPSGASYTVIAASSATIIVGHVLTSDIDGAGDGDTETSGVLTITFVDGVAVKGDQVELECDGTNWYATASCKTYNAITFS
jgi:hypothetical protein